MSTLRIVVLLAILLPVLAVLFYSMYVGLKTGKVPHSDGSSYYNKTTQPVCYWIVMCVFSVFAAALLHALYGLLNPD